MSLASQVMTMTPLYNRTISDGIPIIIVHGWEMNGLVEATDFEPIFKATQGFRRIYIDLPGMGNSPIDGAEDLDAIYISLQASVRTLTTNQRFLLIGSSCGAYLCRALVHDFADQIDGVLLRVPLIEPDNAKRDLDTVKILVENASHMASLSAADAKVFVDVPVQAPIYLEQKRKRIQPTDDAVAVSDGKALARIRNDTSKYCLRRSLDVDNFAAPSLILCGRHDDIVGFRDAWQLMEKYPRASFAVLDRAGHDLPGDEVELFASLVKNWLVRVQQYRTSRAEP